MKLVFDIGIYDGSDTDYYLSKGYKVVGVEANPTLYERAKNNFKENISSGQLTLLNRAICNNSDEEITLTISGDDLGSSSIFENKISHRNPLGSYKVKGMSIADLIKEYGIPHYMKIDIEGADRYCVLPLENENSPQYISFEAGDDMEELISHLKAIGYKKFKAINQCNFNELKNQESLTTRIKRKIIYLLGYKEPNYKKMAGRFFLLGHSSGPVPWLSDGKWQTADDLLVSWKLKESKGELGGWYDIHATK